MNETTNSLYQGRILTALDPEIDFIKTSCRYKIKASANPHKTDTTNATMK